MYTTTIATFVKLLNGLMVELLFLLYALYHPNYFGFYQVLWVGHYRTPASKQKTWANLTTLKSPSNTFTPEIVEIRFAITVSHNQ